MRWVRWSMLVIVVGAALLFGGVALGPAPAGAILRCPLGSFPSSGQTAAYQADKNDTITGPVDVPDDGTVEAGKTLRYQDNGNGTITDLNTKLMWEKKSDDGSIHDKDNTYRWSGDGSQETIWDWLDDINMEGLFGFAGHNDWRIPNVKELQSIVNNENFNPAVSSAFNNNCTAGCTVLTCSCTASSIYWSSSTLANDPTDAWLVFFDGGAVAFDDKTFPLPVRAVRGGCVD